MKELLRAQRSPRHCARRLVKALQRNPGTEEFVYLRRASKHPRDFNPYALQVHRRPGPLPPASPAQPFRPA